MRKVDELFRSTTESLWDTMQSHGARVGFRVPEYQRTYDWDKENLQRLLQDCINGCVSLSQQQSNGEAYTFLGTIILVEEQSEPSFSGTSLSIVDGQQRLTTLCLLCSVLLQQLLSRSVSSDGLDSYTKTWLQAEVDALISALSECICGKLPLRGRDNPFPRIVRGRDDTRAPAHSDAEYRSDIARFLHDFTQYASATVQELEHAPEAPEDSYEAVSNNYRYLSDQVNIYLSQTEEESDTSLASDIECDILRRRTFGHRGLRRLFHQLHSIPDSNGQNRAITMIQDNPNNEILVRLILISWYLLKCVVVTRVETDDERYAFDIFDALNTTGEPLTALETLKPQVVRFENHVGRYAGSDTEHEFDRLESDLRRQHLSTDARQKAIKDLVVSFALYYSAEKKGLELREQRNFLRDGFERVRNLGQSHARRYIESMADLSEFIGSHWELDKIDTIHTSRSDWTDVAKLSLSFISSMKTRVAIPLLARYWVEYGRQGEEQTFIDAIKSIAAFLAIRRAATGGTSGIDGDFRNLMISLKADLNGPPLAIPELNVRLRGYLANPRLRIIDEESWIHRASQVPLATTSTPLCRFLLFAASHHSAPKPSNPGLLYRQGVVPADDRRFLDYHSWTQGIYATVEHVAPATSPGIGWDSRIYETQWTRHTLGNLVLLPQRENSSASNAPWTKKKLFYAALRAHTTDERGQLINEARVEGFEFSKRTVELLGQQGRLRMLDCLDTVDEWTEGFIQRRTTNILELAWDVLYPWLEAS